MEQITPTYLFNKNEDKYFFAGVFNSAQLNIEFTIKELSRRLNIKYDRVNNTLNKAFPNNLSLSDQNTRLDILSESFRFLPLLKQKKDPKDDTKYIPRNIEEIKSLLIELLDFCNQLRHYYTHYNHTQPEFSKELSDLLEDIIYMSAKNVRSRVRTDEYKQHLENKYLQEIEEFVFEENKTRTGKKRIKKGQEIGFVINNALNWYLNTNAESITKNEKLTCTFDNWLSHDGFMILLSLFLNNKQLSQIFSHIKGFKGTHKLRFKITHWIFTFYSYKDIKKLFKSDYQNDSFMLQMIEELTRCPKDLYPYLSKDKKLEFFEDLNSYYQEFVGDVRASEDSLVEHEIVKKRYENKFPYFAIRFLDEYANFPSLRFGIQFGKYNHHTDVKDFKGVNYSTERKILEQIQVFDKLSNVTEKKNKYFVNNKELIATEGWQEFPNPYYQITNNNIPIWLKMDANFKNYPVKERKIGKPSKYDLLNKMGLGDSCKKPIAFLSINELPALLYEFLVKKTDTESIERLIKNKIYKQSQVIRDSIKSNNTDKKKIPRSLIKALEQNISQTDHIDIEKLKRDIIEELNFDPLVQIRSKYKRKKEENKYYLTNAEKGKLATYLSKDIIRFAPADKRKEIRGYQFAEFQELLAFYDLKRNELTDFIKFELGINFRTASFKINECFNRKDLCFFYIDYLKKRKSYLQYFLAIIENNPESITPKHEIFNAFRARTYIIKTAESYVENILKHPANLPRGLFDEKPIAYKGSTKPKLADWFEFCNKPKEAQEFYSFNKYYPIPVNEPDKRKQKDQIVKPEKGIKEQLKRNLLKEDRDFICKNEERIRKTLRNDFYVLEMIKYCFKEITNNEISIDLKSVFINKSTKEKINEKAKEGEVNDAHILSKRLDVSILFDEKKITDNVALKSIGKLEKLKNDSRVGQLLQYFPEKDVWNKSDVDDEIANYDKVRSEQIFKAIHQLEQKIYAMAQSRNETHFLMQNSNLNFKMYLSYFFISDPEERERFNNLNIEHIKIDDPAIENTKQLCILAKIRNKFAHNQLLNTDDFNYIKSVVPMNTGETVAAYLFRCFTLFSNQLVK